MGIRAGTVCQGYPYISCSCGFICWRLVIRLFLASAFLERLIDDPFQLTIHTSKLIRGPFLQGLERVFVDPQYKVFLATHYSCI